MVRVLECYESYKICKQCLDKLAALPMGEIDSKPKSIPAGEGIGRYEAPRGETFHYCRSDGSNRPVRYKVRAPTYMNLPSFMETVVGETISDATRNLAAIVPCYCCTERMVAVDVQSRRNIAQGEDLLRLSWEKTRQIEKSMGLKEDRFERILR